MTDLATLAPDVTSRAPERHAISRLRCWTLVYLGLPPVIFALGWTRPLIGLSVLACASLLLAVAIAETTATENPATENTATGNTANENAATEHGVGASGPIPSAGLRWTLAAVVGVMTGAGALMPQTWDWLKHNAMLRDLVLREWPVMYEVDEHRVGLVYYIGWYLPAAAVGKVFGWQAAQWTLLGWTVIGIGLALAWFVALVGSAARWVPVVFVVFSGLDVVGRVLLSPVLGMTPWELPSGQIDWWAMVGKYPNHVTSVMWGPHHALVGWLGAALIFDMIRRASPRWAGVPVALACLGSPFVAIGLVPLAAFAALSSPAGVVQGVRKSLSVPFALSVGVALPALLYLQGVTVALPVALQATIESGFALSNPIVDLDPVRAVVSYLFLISLEVLVFFVALRGAPDAQSKPLLRRLLVTIVLTLVLLPLYRYGKWSDLAMRAVVPSMFVLAVFVVRALTQLPRTAWQRMLLIGVLVLGLAGPVTELGPVAIDSNSGREQMIKHLDRGSLTDSSGVLELADTVYIEAPRFLTQYVGSTESFFFRHLAAGS